MAQKIRWNNFVLYLLKIRYNEVSKLKDGLVEREDLDDPIYISMIKDIHKDQLDFIKKCRSLFVVRLDDLSSKMSTFWLYDYCILDEYCNKVTLMTVFQGYFEYQVECDII